MSKTPEQLTGISNMSAALFAIYNSPELMREWLSVPVTLKARWERASNCLLTAQRPGFKFGLEVVPLPVRRVIEAFLAEIKNEIQQIRNYITIQRTRGLAWDTVWSAVAEKYPGTGFSYGDGRSLGVY